LGRQAYKESELAAKGWRPQTDADYTGAERRVEDLSRIEIMNSDYPTESDFAKAIETAAGTAIQELFEQYPDHHFYYLSLITSGEIHPPVLAAWSQEALEDAVKDEADQEDARWGLKWSYADSPFFCFGEEHFVEVKRLFDLRPAPHLQNEEAYAGSSREAESNLRLASMESAIASLDRRGMFGTGKERAKIVVNVEVMPPDATNTERAKRLNPPEAIRTWLEEAAE
jgi:hypothetical protein